MADAAPAESEGASVGVWIGLSVIAAISFYCQATVTEERFVPALNVLVINFNIPDDVAGATLMAAGASSPELFSSLVALFITHSALGLGTIVGSEIFNQLVICAGAVYAAKSGQLKLDAAVVTREVGFYAIGIACLLYALRDTAPADDDELGPDHIYISFSDALVVALPYLLYIIVCANFEQIVAFCTRNQSDPEDRRAFGKDYNVTNKGSVYGSFHMPEDMPYAHKTFHGEPPSNFEEQESTVGENEARASFLSAGSGKGSFLGSGVGSFLAQTLHLRSSQDSQQSVGSLRLFGVEVKTEKPSDIHALYDLSSNAYAETLSCFLWQRSFFYTKAKFSQHGWHLRWFTFTHDSVSSVPDKAYSEKHKMVYPRFRTIEIDDKRQMLKIENPKWGHRDYYFLAPSREIFDAVVAKCESIMAIREAESTRQSTPLDDPPDVDVNDMSNGGEETSLVEFPWAGSPFEVGCHCLLFPFKALMHYTIPDVRHLDSEGKPKGGLCTTTLAIVMCLVWLIIGSYAMVASLEGLAELMDIPDAVIGVTVSAAGTSLPNYVASKVAAQQGFGNMAVSNAFGSNTFNIMVGLGWPWVLYIAFANKMAPYHGLRNEGILESVIILATVLLIFIIIVLKDNFTLYRWHGTLFIILYIAYLAFAIGQVYL